jgi:outer membrane protein assembly factor BamB
MSSLKEVLEAELDLPPHDLAPGPLRRLRSLVEQARVVVLPVGERVADRFVVRRILGVGGFALVYGAWDERLETEVALKVLLPDHEGGPELRTLARHRHPNVVPVLDGGRHDGMDFMALELLERSLRDRLNEGPISRPDGLALFRQVAEALRFLHGRAVVHRDLKPDNVLLAAELARVADFGLAAAVNGPAMRAGTLLHVAPEQLEGAAPDVRQDIYSLGVLLLQLLGGQPRGPEADAEHYREALEATPRPRAPGASAGLQAIVDKATEPQASQRYATVDALLLDLDLELQDQSLVGARETQPAAKWFRRRRDRLLSVGLTLLVVGSTAAAMLSRPAALHLTHEAPAGWSLEREGDSWSASSLPSWRAGIHHVELSAPGHVTQRRDLVLYPGQAYELDPRLVPSTGRVSLTTWPDDAVVDLPSGQRVGALDEDLPEGRTPVVVRAPGRMSVRTVLDVGGETTTVRLSLPELVEARQATTGERVWAQPGGQRVVVATPTALELRRQQDLELVGKARLDAPLTTSIRWFDVDGDGHDDALFGDARRRLVVRAGPDLVRTLWSEELPSPYTGDPRDGLRSAPIVAAGVLYVGGSDGRVLAREPATGAPLWSRAVGAGRELHGSLAVAGGLVLAPSQDGHVYALDALTGEPRWSAPASHDIKADVAVVDGRVLLVDEVGQLLVLDLATGAALGTHDGASPDPRSAAACWKEGQEWRVLEVGSDGQVHAQDLDRGSRRLLGRVEGAAEWSLVLDGEPRVALIGTDRQVHAIAFDDDASWPLFEREVPILYPPSLLQDETGVVAFWVEGDEVVRVRLQGSPTAWWVRPEDSQAWPVPAPDHDGDGVSEVLMVEGGRLLRLSGATGQVLDSTPVNEGTRLVRAGERLLALSMDRWDEVDLDTLMTRPGGALPGRPEWRWMALPLWRGMPLLGLTRGRAGQEAGLAILGEEVRVLPAEDHLFAPPVLVGDEVVLLSDTGHLERLELATGAHRWGDEADAGILRGRAIGGLAELGGRLVGRVREVGLVGVDPDTGEALWLVPARPVQQDMMQPAIVGELVVVSDGPDRAVAVDRDGRVRWSYQHPELDLVVAPSPEGARIVLSDGRQLPVSAHGVGPPLPGRIPWRATGALVLDLGGGYELAWARLDARVLRTGSLTPEPRPYGRDLTPAGAVYAL